MLIVSSGRAIFAAPGDELIGHSLLEAVIHAADAPRMEPTYTHRAYGIWAMRAMLLPMQLRWFIRHACLYSWQDTQSISVTLVHSGWRPGEADAGVVLLGWAASWGGVVLLGWAAPPRSGTAGCTASHDCKIAFVPRPHFLRDAGQVATRNELQRLAT